MAYKRHFPAINWLNGYSLYLDDVWRHGTMRSGVRLDGRPSEDDDPLLQEEAELEEIVKMVGMDALSPGDRV